MHWKKKRIYTKFAQRKYDANICFLQSKPVANMVNATFATILTQVCKYGSKCGIYHVCCSFALEETYVCNLLALCKFGVNPFFRPVMKAEAQRQRCPLFRMLRLRSMEPFGTRKAKCHGHRALRAE